MKFYAKIICVIISTVLLLLLCGCGEDKYNNPVYTEIKSKVVTLDPQLAENQGDREIVLNIFEGLMRLDQDDRPTFGVAEDYTLEGNTYTFNLRENAVWSDGTPLTAEDFVFGLRRAAMKETDAPDFPLISLVCGATAVHNGADASSLAVSAIDEHTLAITLEHPDEEFLYSLCLPICMPCHEEFFRSSKGKYGRTGDTVLSNGSFCLDTLNTESGLVRIVRNEKYAGDFKSVPSAVYFTLPDKELSTVGRISKSNIDIGFIGGADIDDAENEKLEIKQIYNRYYCIFINDNSVLGNRKVKNALYLSVDHTGLESVLKDGLMPQRSIVSRECKADNNSVYDAAVFGSPYDKDAAYGDYLAASKQLPSIKNITLLYPDVDGMKDVAGFIATTWQRDLGLFINMASVDSYEDVNRAVKSGDYTVAIGCIETSSPTAQKQLSAFSDGNNYGFDIGEYNAFVNSLNYDTPFDATVNAVKSAQNIILYSRNIIPIVASPTVMCYSKGLGNVNYSLYNKSTDYSVIMKK